jgi:hypothetical protein
MKKILLILLFSFHSLSWAIQDPNACDNTEDPAGCRLDSATQALQAKGIEVPADEPTESWETALALMNALSSSLAFGSIGTNEVNPCPAPSYFIILNTARAQSIFEMLWFRGYSAKGKARQKIFEEQMSNELGPYAHELAYEFLIDQEKDNQEVYDKKFKYHTALAAIYGTAGALAMYEIYQMTLRPDTTITGKDCFNIHNKLGLSIKEAEDRIGAEEDKVAKEEEDIETQRSEVEVKKKNLVKAQTEIRSKIKKLKNNGLLNDELEGEMEHDIKLIGYQMEQLDNRVRLLEEQHVELEARRNDLKSYTDKTKSRHKELFDEANDCLSDCEQKRANYDNAVEESKQKFKQLESGIDEKQKSFNYVKKSNSRDYIEDAHNLTRFTDKDGNLLENYREKEIKIRKIEVSLDASIDEEKTSSQEASDLHKRETELKKKASANGQKELNKVNEKFRVAEEKKLKAASEAKRLFEEKLLEEHGISTDTSSGTVDVKELAYTTKLDDYIGESDIKREALVESLGKEMEGCVYDYLNHCSGDVKERFKVEMNRRMEKTRVESITNYSQTSAAYQNCKVTSGNCDAVTNDLVKLKNAVNQGNVTVRESEVNPNLEININPRGKTDYKTVTIGELKGKEVYNELSNSCKITGDCSYKDKVRIRQFREAEGKK